MRPDEVADHDAGERRTRVNAVAGVALAWCAFQFWVASPLPLEFGVLVFGDGRVRSLHLAFALLLTFLIHPVHTRPHARWQRLDVAVGALAAFCAAYLFLFHAELGSRPGQPAAIDLLVATGGVLLLLEATRRVVGLSMVLLVVVLLAYVFLGPYAPELIAHKGASLGRAMGHLWLSTEGVFGIALRVSAGFIFLFVVFGALLESSGGGAYMVRSAVSLVGHMRGGPAKAAVGVSAATGLISGSTITNIVTTGPLTMPLIKRAGYPPEKAAAVEVASSVNGQVMPPVMGAAAFLMVESVGVPYIEVLRHALISALISYLGLLYIVHLEAVKADLRGLPRRRPPRWQRSLPRFVLGFVAALVVMLLAAKMAGRVDQFLPWRPPALIVASYLLAYLWLLRIAARQPAPPDDDHIPLRAMPDPGTTLRSGLYYLLPLLVLMWNLVIERLSPGRAVFWACALLVFIVLTHRPLLAWMRGDTGGAVMQATRRGLHDLRQGLVNGARSMILVAVATAAAGIVVGTVTLTGIGLVMTELVEVLSGGNVLIMLLMVAMICLVLGMGLPTTASYVVVSTLMAPVIVTLGAQNGVPIPLIAAHLFVFYFGLLADIMPPVGLASYAAASIAGARPLRTAYIAFRYTMRMAVLPFMFVFNPQLLLIGVHGLAHTLLVLASAALAGLVFIAVNQNWLIVRCLAWERLVLLLASFMLFHPAFFMDRLRPATEALAGDAALHAVLTAPDFAHRTFVLQGRVAQGLDAERTVSLPLGRRSDVDARLATAGVVVVRKGAELVIESIVPSGVAGRLGLVAGARIVAVEEPRGALRAEWLFLPALCLIALIVYRQSRRRPS